MMVGVQDAVPHRRLLFVCVMVRPQRVTWVPQASAASERNAVSRCATEDTNFYLSCANFCFFFGRGPVGETVCGDWWQGLPLAALRGHVQSAPMDITLLVVDACSLQRQSHRHVRPT